MIKINFDKTKLGEQSSSGYSPTKPLITKPKPFDFAEALAKLNRLKAEVAEQASESRSLENSITSQVDSLANKPSDSASPSTKINLSNLSLVDKAILVADKTKVADLAKSATPNLIAKSQDYFNPNRQSDLNRLVTSLDHVKSAELTEQAVKESLKATEELRSPANEMSMQGEQTELSSASSATKPKTLGFNFAKASAVAHDEQTESEQSSSSPIANSDSSTSFAWDDSQLSAIESILSNPFNCLIGAAGSGKTTVVREIVRRLEEDGTIQPLAYQKSNGDSVESYNVAFVSFTGKAVEQLRKSIPPHLQCCCQTIHSLLEYAPEIIEKTVEDENGDQVLKQSKIFLPRRDELNPLPQQIIFIDESGMVGVELWNNLFKALRPSPSLKIVLIGDINQLPAVIGKSILGYALASPRWKTATLTKIHRQAMDNPIIANAHRIKSGDQPESSPSITSPDGTPLLRKFSLLNIGSLTNDERNKIRDGTLPRSYYDDKNKSVTTLKNFIRLVNTLYRSGYYDPAVDQIIVPQNTGTIGQEMINSRLAPIFNSANKRIAIRASLETKFLAVGDKVMFTKNDYDYGILNGMTGYIKEIRLNGDYRDYALLKQAEESGGAPEKFEVTADSIDLAESLLDADLNKLESDNSATEVEQQASHVVTIEYTPIGSTEPSTIAISSVGLIRGLLLAYAITCHKAQGSEYRRVIVLAHSSNSQMLSREWLYTAVTRARENLVLVYNDYQGKGLPTALRRQVIAGETLEEKAKNFSLAEAKKTSDTFNESMIPMGIFTDDELTAYLEENKND